MLVLLENEKPATELPRKNMFAVGDTATPVLTARNTPAG